MPAGHARSYGRRISHPPQEASMRSITLIATTTAFALAAPSAMALPVIDPPATAAPAPVIVRATDDGFDWGAAGVGAAATGGLVLVAVGGFGAAHRGRVRVAR